MSYRPTDLSLLKEFWKFLNFKHDCNFPSEYTVQSNFSSPWSGTYNNKDVLLVPLITFYYVALQGNPDKELCDGPSGHQFCWKYFIPSLLKAKSKSQWLSEWDWWVVDFQKILKQKCRFSKNKIEATSILSVQFHRKLFLTHQALKVRKSRNDFFK